MTTTKQRRTAIADRLREQRGDSGLTQEALAKKAGLDRKTVNRIENALFSPSVDTIFRLCRVLEITPAKFLDRLP
jgi:transcriptional regulator with XRE-family HTH domain